MKDFIAIVFLAAFVFFLSMLFFRSYGPFVFIFIVIAGLVSVVMNQDARIVEMEKILGLKDNKDKSETEGIHEALEVTSHNETE